MKVLTLKNPGCIVRGDADEPPAPDEGFALVRVHRIGVCGTDIHAFNGNQPFFSYPRILGHELGVEVVSVAANDRGIQPGSRCSVEPYLNCGRCVACRRGRGNTCVELRVLGVHVDGGHREFLSVPVDKLHPSSSLDFDQLALVETLSIGAHAVDRARIEGGETVLVIGTGPIGLAVIQFAQAAGARVIAMDIDETRLAFCRETLGVPETVLAGGADVTGELRALSDGDLPTAVFDATGNSRSMMSSFQYPAHGGRLVFVGLFSGDVTFDDPNFHRRELTLLASRNSRPEDFSRIIRLVEEGRVDTTPWITHRGAFDEVPVLFSSWVQPGAGVLKAMIEL